MTAVAWPFLPSTIKESLAFKTDVRRAYSAESRDSLRDAVQSLELHSLMLDQEASKALELFRSNPVGSWYVPVWFDMSIAGTIAAGATSITVDTNADYRVGEKAIIWTDYATFELVDVSAVGTGSITVSAVVGSYTEPAVAPVRECIATSGLSSIVRPTFREISVPFLSLTAVDLAATTYPTVGGFQVLTDPSVVVQDLAGGISQALSLVDNGFGAFEIIATESYVRPRATVGFLDYLTATRWARRRWLHDMRGRDGAFFLPSWKADLVLTAAAASGDLTITVADVLPSAAAYIGRYIQIDVDGTYVHRQITAASAVAGVATLTISAPGITVPTSAVLSFLDLVRFDTDQFDMQHDRAVQGFMSSFSAIVVGVQQ